MFIKNVIAFSAATAVLSFSPAVLAQEEDAAAAMARALQNPLANIQALMTDNAIGFDTGSDGGTSYGFQLQPVYAIDFADKGFTFIPRAVIPILALEPGTQAPPTGGGPTPGGSSRAAGLGDSIFQFFFAPHIKSAWKWGIGPQISAKTHTNSDLKGPEWGAGLAGIVTGSLSEDLSFAGIIGHHWGFSGDFSTTTIQPMFYYNIKSNPGATLMYNAATTVDWKASSGNQWTVPLGLSYGKTFALSGGGGLDMNIGPYYNVVRPDGAAKWSLRFGITWIF